VAPGRVDADAVDLDAEGAELVKAFSELGKLVRSTRRKVKHIGQQDDGATGEGV
jgi:hypothetical protein